MGSVTDSDTGEELLAFPDFELSRRELAALGLGGEQALIAVMKTLAMTFHDGCEYERNGRAGDLDFRLRSVHVLKAAMKAK